MYINKVRQAVSFKATFVFQSVDSLYPISQSPWTSNYIFIIPIDSHCQPWPSSAAHELTTRNVPPSRILGRVRRIRLVRNSSLVPPLVPPHHQLPEHTQNRLPPPQRPPFTTQHATFRPVQVIIVCLYIKYRFTFLLALFSRVFWMFLVRRLLAVVVHFEHLQFVIHNSICSISLELGH